MTFIVLIAAACQQETARMVQDTPPQTQPSEQPAATGTAPSPVQEVHLIEYAIHMPQTLAAGQNSFRVENGGKEQHSFEIEGNGVHASLPSALSRGSTTSLDVNLQPGTYTVYCPIKGHRERGMETKVTVK